MEFFILFAFALTTTIFSAKVREFPFGVFNDTEENATSSENITAMSTIVTEVAEHLIHLEEEINETTPEGNFTWNSEASPILSVLRNFWAQASVGLLEPIDTQSVEPIDKNAKQVFRALEHGLLEATTMLMSQIEETTLATLSSKESEQIEQEKPVASKRKGDLPDEASKERFTSNTFVKNKRQTAFDLMANMSTSCSNCYEKLNTCVQQCFVSYNCHDIQRGVRVCPPVPNRLCNPFTQWNPIDECSSDSDCKSPLLCCNDGCVNKCQPGVWSS